MFGTQQATNSKAAAKSRFPPKPPANRSPTDQSTSQMDQLAAAATTTTSITPIPSTTATATAVTAATITPAPPTNHKRPYVQKTK